MRTSTSFERHQCTNRTKPDEALRRDVNTLAHTFKRKSHRSLSQRNVYLYHTHHEFQINFRKIYVSQRHTHTVQRHRLWLIHYEKFLAVYRLAGIGLHQLSRTHVRVRYKWMWESDWLNEWQMEVKCSHLFTLNRCVVRVSWTDLPA